MCDHPGFRPVRAPWSPSSSTRSCATRPPRYPRSPFSVRFRRLFPLAFAVSRAVVPPPLGYRAQAQASLLCFLLANAVVTRRRVQVYTLPLSVPGLAQCPLAAYHLRQAPIVVQEGSRSFQSVGVPGLLRHLFNRGPAAILASAFARASLAVRFRLATPRPNYGPSTHVTPV